MMSTPGPGDRVVGSWSWSENNVRCSSPSVDEAGPVIIHVPVSFGYADLP